MKNQILFACFMLPGIAFAQTEELPAYAYDGVALISLATTADQVCDKITVREKRLRVFLQDLYGRLAADGVSPVDAASHFETEIAVEQIGARAVAFREKYGIGPENDEAFCRAILAKTSDDDAFGKLLKTRR